VKNHWNATARRKDAPVQNKDGTSVVLREHLLRTKCGDPNLEVVQVTVGGVSARDIAARLAEIEEQTRGRGVRVGVDDARDTSPVGGQRAAPPGSLDFDESLADRDVTHEVGSFERFVSPQHKRLKRSVGGPVGSVAARGTGWKGLHTAASISLSMQRSLTHVVPSGVGDNSGDDRAGGKATFATATHGSALFGAKSDVSLDEKQSKGVKRSPSSSATTLPDFGAPLTKKDALRGAHAKQRGIAVSARPRDARIAPIVAVAAPAARASVELATRGTHSPNGVCGTKTGTSSSDVSKNDVGDTDGAAPCRGSRDKKDQRASSSGDTHDGSSSVPGDDDLMMACMRRVRAQKGASYHFREGTGGDELKQPKPVSVFARVAKRARLEKTPPRAFEPPNGLRVAVSAIPENETPRFSLDARNARPSDFSDISQWDLTPRSEGRGTEEDPMLAACAAAAAAAGDGCEPYGDGDDTLRSLSVEEWFDRDLSTGMDGESNGGNELLGTLNDDDVLGTLRDDELRYDACNKETDGFLMGDGDGDDDGDERKPTTEQNHKGNRQLDELENLVATVGLRKALECLRGAIGPRERAGLESMLSA
jgi:hypothetical protein